jgi:predicted transcriptional regulator of viral defense system
MPRTFVRKTTRGISTEGQLEAALKRRAVNIKENLSKKICLKKQKEKRTCRRKIKLEESGSEESAEINETELHDDAELDATEPRHRD